jgi:DNA-binding NarL/FixJ family response regulator
LALVRDLMFSGKIVAEARAAGADCKIVRDPTKLQDADGKLPRLLLVDLNLEGAIEAAAEWRKSEGKPVIGFVSHVDSATIERAKQAGIDRVLPRSQFVRLLPELVREPPLKEVSP